MSLDLNSANREYASRPAEERFASVEAFREALRARKLASRTFRGPQRKLTVIATDDELQLRVGDAAQLQLTHNGLAQLATLAGAPAPYLRTLPARVAADALNHSLSTVEPAYDSGNVKLLAHVNGTTRLRAVTSESYGRVWDSDVAEALFAFAERVGANLHPAPGWDKSLSLYASDRDMFAMLIDGGSVIEEPSGFSHRPSALHRGIMVRNSETGDGTLDLLGFWFRVICGNYMIHDGRVFANVSIRHTRMAPERFASRDFVTTVRASLEASTARDVELIRQAGRFMLPELREARVTWLRTHAAFSKGEALDTLATADAEEGDSRTLWQAIQGATAVARQRPYAADRVDLATRATALLRFAA